MTLEPRLRLRSFIAFAVALLAVSAPLAAVAGDASTRTSRTSKSSRSPKTTHYSVTTDDSALPGELEAWTLARENGRQRNSHGSERDRDEVERLLERDPGDLFWFRRNGER